MNQSFYLEKRTPYNKLHIIIDFERSRNQRQESEYILRDLIALGGFWLPTPSIAFLSGADKLLRCELNSPQMHNGEDTM